MTEDSSESELWESLFDGTKLDLPDLPSHSQATEQAVKLTTEASQTVDGFEARHQHITATFWVRNWEQHFYLWGLIWSNLTSYIKLNWNCVCFSLFFVCYIFTYNRKKSIFKVFKYYVNVKRQFIEIDTENGFFFCRFSIWRLVIISLIIYHFYKIKGHSLI